MWASPWMIGLRLVLYMVISSGALLLLKTAPTGFLNPRFIAGFLLYGLSFVIWWSLLRVLPLSVAFPVATGIQAVALQLVGRYLLHERLPLAHLLGLSLILAGVALVFGVSQARGGAADRGAGAATAPAPVGSPNR